jgi:hypothetical protein
MRTETVAVRAIVKGPCRAYILAKTGRLRLKICRGGGESFVALRSAVQTIPAAVLRGV